MNHLNEQQLIEHYYGEDTDHARAEQHLRACRECSDAYQAMVRDLSEMNGVPVPARDANYGATVWEAIRTDLPAHAVRKWWKNGFGRWMVYASACALLLLSAFVGGRYWEHTHSTPQVAADPNAKERVVLVVLQDHLDRSERLLTELKHASLGDDARMQDEARDLLAENRLFRQSARQIGASSTTAALERLERLLVELANTQGGISEAELARLQDQVNREGLLFEIRVLKSQSGRVSAPANVPSRSTT